MWVILPGTSFIALFLILLSVNTNTPSNFQGWRRTFLKTSIIWSVFIVLSTEGLSLLDEIALVSLKILWGSTLLVLLYIGVRERAFQSAWINLRHKTGQKPHAIDFIFVGILAVIILFIFTIALKAVPSNTDSLLYHMSRVAHWMQNQSMQHYNTQYSQQLTTPPLAESIVLHLRMLAGNDHIANLVQWFSMLGSIIGVTLIAKMLGAGVREQLLAAFFTISIPMGILQATSTQTDYVTSFWLICLLFFVLKGKKGQLEGSEWIYVGLSLGLGMLTKVVFYLYAFPVLLWYFLPRLRRKEIRSTLSQGVGIAVLALLINSGFWARNIQTYGGPFGPGEYISTNSNLLIDPRVWITASVKQISLDFVSTIPKFNKFLEDGVSGVQEFLGLDDVNFTIIPGWNHEDLAANPLHMSLVFLSIMFLLISFRNRDLDLARTYAGTVLCGFFLFSIMLQFTPYKVRFHLPFFVMWGAVFAAIANSVNLKRWVYVCCLLFVVASLPWLLFNSTRSVIAIRPYTRMGGSIFKETTTAILFANWHNLSDIYTEATETIKDSGCKQVGLNIDSHDVEYPFWRLLDAPESGIRIEAVGTYPYLERYRDTDFSACVVICSLCGDKQEYLGLEKFLDLGEGFALYLGSEYSNNK
ncbi:MAG: glycosyltransferase family 39 protein [Anaerolineales bacterium]